MNLHTFIRDIPDFPKPGIIFKDITPLLLNPKAVLYCLDKLVEPLQELAIDKVVGIESRGFIFGNLIAQRLQSGFVPVRKPGKLPGQTISAKYTLEYGTNELQLHTDAIMKGDRVLIHDDLLATGGTARAAADLVHQLGGQVIRSSFIIQLAFLEGNKKLPNIPVSSVLVYD